jgi:hypothetical protein
MNRLRRKRLEATQSPQHRRGDEVKHDGRDHRGNELHNVDLSKLAALHTLLQRRLQAA